MYSAEIKKSSYFFNSQTNWFVYTSFLFYFFLLSEFAFVGFCVLFMLFSFFLHIFFFIYLVSCLTFFYSFHVLCFACVFYLIIYCGGAATVAVCCSWWCCYCAFCLVSSMCVDSLERVLTSTGNIATYKKKKKKTASWFIAAIPDLASYNLCWTPNDRIIYIHGSRTATHLNIYWFIWCCCSCSCAKLAGLLALITHSSQYVRSNRCYQCLYLEENISWH